MLRSRDGLKVIVNAAFHWPADASGTMKPPRVQRFPSRPHHNCTGIQFFLYWIPWWITRPCSVRVSRPNTCHSGTRSRSSSHRWSTFEGGHRMRVPVHQPLNLSLNFFIEVCSEQGGPDLKERRFRCPTTRLSESSARNRQSTPRDLTFIHEASHNDKFQPAWKMGAIRKFVQCSSIATIIEGCSIDIGFYFMEYSVSTSLNWHSQCHALNFVLDSRRHTSQIFCAANEEGYRLPRRRSLRRFILWRPSMGMFQWTLRNDTRCVIVRLYHNPRLMGWATIQIFTDVTRLFFKPDTLEARIQRPDVIWKKETTFCVLTRITK